MQRVYRHGASGGRPHHHRAHRRPHRNRQRTGGAGPAHPQPACRRNRLVVVNCAAIPEALLESELFGYTRGAFTGAVQSQLGRIPAAHGGTLFLDEVSELPLGMQAKLLRFLEQKEIQRLGTSEVTRVDVRVLAASNVDLAGRAARGEISPGPLLPALGLSHRVAAAGGAPRRHCAAGGTFSGVHGGGHGDAVSALEPECKPHSSKPIPGGQCARTAACDGAGIDSCGKRRHHRPAEHLYFSDSAQPVSRMALPSES